MLLVYFGIFLHISWKKVTQTERNYSQTWLITWKTIYTETKLKSVERKGHVDIHMIRTMINMLLSIKKSKHYFGRCTASRLALVLNIFNQRGPVNSVSPPLSNTSVKSIHFTRVSYVIQTAFSYLSVKFQLTVWQNLIMILLNYTLPIEANLLILQKRNFSF